MKIGTTGMFARNSFFVLALLLPVTIVSGWCQQISSASDEVLTLDQAIALALRENHSVRDAELEGGKSLDALAASRTSRLPSIVWKRALSQITCTFL